MAQVFRNGLVMMIGPTCASSLAAQWDPDLFHIRIDTNRLIEASEHVWRNCNRKDTTAIVG
jgi:hypothetical protein